MVISQTVLLGLSTLVTIGNAIRTTSVVKAETAKATQASDQAKQLAQDALHQIEMTEAIAKSAKEMAEANSRRITETEEHLKTLATELKSSIDSQTEMLLNAIRKGTDKPE